MCTNNYLNKERFNKVIAKIKWCSFYAIWADLSSILSQITRLTDGQTDRQTDRILIARPRLHSMQRGNDDRCLSRFAVVRGPDLILHRATKILRPWLLYLYSPAALRRHRRLAGTHWPTHEGMARLSRPGWLVAYRDKCTALGIKPGHGHPSQY